MASIALEKFFKVFIMTSQLSMSELPTTLAYSNSILHLLTSLLSILQTPHYSLALGASHLLFFMKGSYPHSSLR